MSRLRRAMFKKKLKEILQTTNDKEFFVMAWAALAIQSGRQEQARPFLAFPEEAATGEIKSPYAVYPWRIETLLNEVLATPKAKFSTKRLKCSSFSAVVAVMRILGELENAEDGLTLSRVSVLNEIHRLSQRQFEWQRGFASHPQIYRAGFIYGGELTRSYFSAVNGLTINEFSLACFGLMAAFERGPFLKETSIFEKAGIAQSIIDLTLNMICVDHSKACEISRRFRRMNGHTGYKRSFLRDFPCVSFGSKERIVIAPLPNLIMSRSTSGLFYDVINGSGNVKNEISGRFELYCYELLMSMLPSYGVQRSYKYKVKKGEVVDTPDVIISIGGEISIICECKARRMSYEARFAEDPVAEAEGAYREMAKGVLQIWLFVSHLRRGLVEAGPLRKDAKGLVLTMDTWFSAANGIQSDVLEIAKEMAKQKDSQITELDRIPVTFCPVYDLEQALRVSNEASFARAVDAAAEKEFRGWQLWMVHNHLFPDVREENPYPFSRRIGDVLPWWSQYNAPCSPAA